MFLDFISRGCVTWRTARQIRAEQEPIRSPSPPPRSSRHPPGPLKPPSVSASQFSQFVHEVNQGPPPGFTPANQGDHSASISDIEQFLSDKLPLECLSAIEKLDEKYLRYLYNSLAFDVPLKPELKKYLGDLAQYNPESGMPSPPVPGSSSFQLETVQPSASADKTPNLEASALRSRTIRVASDSRQEFDTAPTLDASALRAQTRAGASVRPNFDRNSTVFDDCAAKFDERAAKFDERAAKFDKHAAKFDKHAAKFDKRAAPFDDNSSEFDDLADGNDSGDDASEFDTTSKFDKRSKAVASSQQHQATFAAPDPRQQSAEQRQSGNALQGGAQSSADRDDLAETGARASTDEAYSPAKEYERENSQHREESPLSHDNRRLQINRILDSEKAHGGLGVPGHGGRGAPQLQDKYEQSPSSERSSRKSRKRSKRSRSRSSSRSRSRSHSPERHRSHKKHSKKYKKRRRHSRSRSRERRRHSRDRRSPTRSRRSRSQDTCRSRSPSPSSFASFTAEEEAQFRQMEEEERRLARVESENRRLREQLRQRDQQVRHSQPTDLVPDPPPVPPNRPRESDHVRRMALELGGPSRTIPLEPEVQQEYGGHIPPYCPAVDEPYVTKQTGRLSIDDIVPLTMDVARKATHLFSLKQEESRTREQPIPPNELLPPEGFELPGLSDGYRPQDLEEQWRQLRPGSSMPPPAPLRPGRPLSQLRATLGDSLKDKWKVRMENAAGKIRKFMTTSFPTCTNTAAAGARKEWEITPEESAAPGKLPPGSPSSSPEPVVEELRQIGLPITATHEEFIQTVAYAPNCSDKSPYAQTIRVPEADYQRVLRWNTRLAEFEAQPLVIEDPKLGGKHTPSEIVDQRCKDDKSTKSRFEHLQKQVNTSRDSLKCHCAAGAALEAAERAQIILDNGLRRAQEAFDTLFKSLEGTRMISDNRYTNTTQFKELKEGLLLAKSAADTLRPAHQFAQGAAQAGTDAAVRGVRTAVESIRMETIRAIFQLKDEAKQTAVEKVGLQVPVVPSSLFGGRWQVTLNLLGHQYERKETMEETVQKVTGVKLNLGSRRGRPFPRGGRGGRGGGSGRNASQRDSSQHTSASATAVNTNATGNKGKGKKKLSAAQMARRKERFREFKKRLAANQKAKNRNKQFQNRPATTK